MEGGAAYNDGRISVGDRLVAVKNLPTGDFYLDNCTHEESVQVRFVKFSLWQNFCLLNTFLPIKISSQALKASKEKVYLLISKVYSQLRKNTGRSSSD